jgi:hypothetical protein
MLTRTSRHPGLKGEPDEGELQRKSHPFDHLTGQVIAVLSRDGVLQVGRPDDDEKDGSRNAGPPVPAPQADSANQFADSAGIDQFGS